MGYNRTVCLDSVTHLLKNTTYVAENPQYFFPGSDTTPNATYPVLTSEGCDIICGSTWGLYDDGGPRVEGWILPVVLLIANVHFPPIGFKRFCMILRIMGDPIGSIWWYLRTLKEWNDCYREAGQFLNSLDITSNNADRKAVTLAFIAAAKFMESQQLEDAFKRAIDKICNENISDTERRERFKKLRKAGSTIADFQDNDIRRTVFAVLLYIIQVLSLFVPALGGSPEPSGGRVSPAMMLIWLIPLVLISNAIGDSASWRQSEKTLARFLEDMQVVGSGDIVPVEHHQLEVLARATIAPQFSKARITSSTPSTSNTPKIPSRPRPHPTGGFHRAIHAIGSAFTVLIRVIHSALPLLILPFCSSFPVLTSFAIAFAVDDTPPTWFSCRAIFNIVTVLAWCLSALVTATLISSREKRDNWVPIIVLIKDFVIAAAFSIIIVLSTCGWFNSCMCSSGVLNPYRGNRGARVDVNPTWGYAHNGTVYIVGVSVGLGLEFLFFLAVLLRFYKLFGSVWWKDSKDAHSLVTTLPLDFPIRT